MALQFFRMWSIENTRKKIAETLCKTVKNTFAGVYGWWFVICKATPETARQRKVAKVARDTNGRAVILLFFLTDGLDFVFQMCQHLAVYIQVGFAHSVKQKVRQAVQFGICRHQ